MFPKAQSSLWESSFKIRFTVLLLKPVSRTISTIRMPFSARMRTVSFFAFGQEGLPPLRPLAFALANPSFVLCTTKSRSSWLIPLMTVRRNWLYGLSEVVSNQVSFNDLIEAFFSRTFSTIINKSFVLLEILVKSGMIKTSPGCKSSRSRFNSGRCKDRVR